jgi:hypothetical protein
MRSAILLLVFLAPVAAQAPERQRPWWPQPYAVKQDDAARTLTLSTPYYTIEYDLRRGGAISRISLTHGKARNLLVTPAASSVRLQVREVIPAEAPRSHADSFVTYSDLRDENPVVSHRTDGGAVIVTVESRLLAQEGGDSGIKVKSTYANRWGYIKIRKEFLPSGRQAKVKALTVLSTVLHPSLMDYGYRPAVSEEMGSNPHEWTNGQIRRWGKIRPGAHFDLPFRTRYVPRYLVLANHGVEGLEWFVSDNLAQWDYQLTGRPGAAAVSLSASAEPLGIQLSIDALNLSSGSVMPRGGYLELHEIAMFDYYIGFPILPGHANRPWLHESMRGTRNHEGRQLTEADIRHWAEAGIREITLHNDGDAFRDGIFWRDGSYPPYPPKVMQRMDELIALCHQYGIRVAPYFSNHELHQSTEEYRKHGEEWGRKPDDQGNLRPNYYYGSHMCLKSGWLDFLKLCVDRVLTNHRFDGIYYDWNIAMYCNNPLHVGNKADARRDERGLAALAHSPTGHWDIEELIALVEWTRQRVGKEGLFILHNTLVPMFTTENFADRVVGMEFGYTRALTSMPKVADLPLEWSFAGARSRGVIVRGTVEDNAPERTFRLHALTGLMTQSMPWRANSHAIEFVRLLRLLGDIEQYKFEDWRNTAVSLNDADCLSAIYSREGESYILLANFGSGPKQVLCTLRPRNLAYPLATVRRAEVLLNGRSSPIDAARLAGPGASIALPVESAILLRVQR